jgi:hypothetical protein
MRLILRASPPPSSPPSFPFARSFPGLYESLHNKVVGQWDTGLWGQYIQYRAKASPLPWDPSTGDVDDGKRRELMLGIAAKAGVKPEDLGFTVPPAPAAPAAAAPAKGH